MTRTLHFTRHYIEMLIAMALGMGVLGIGYALLPSSRPDVIELRLLLMALAMSVPMVAWMRHRGHGWAPAGEMTASMFIPSFAAIALLWAGTVQDEEALLAIQHMGMFPAMLVAMLLRRDEYSHHVRHAVAAAA